MRWQHCHDRPVVTPDRSAVTTLAAHALLQNSLLGYLCNTEKFNLHSDARIGEGLVNPGGFQRYGDA